MMKKTSIVLIFILIILVTNACEPADVGNILPSSIPPEPKTNAPAPTNTAVATSTPNPTSTPSLPAQPTATNMLETTSAIREGGLLSGQPCKAPCFFGVKIGETDFEQVISMLKDHGISPCFIIDGNGSNIYIACGAEHQDVQISQGSNTTLVDSIAYAPSIPVSVEEIIAQHGEPNFVEIQQGYDNSKEKKILTATLYWDTLSMLVTIPAIPYTSEHEYAIENGTIVEWISYWDQETYKDWLHDEYTITTPWNGFGVYK